MDDGTIESSHLLRLIGMLAIGVGFAWALQTIGFGGEAAFDKTVWVIASAAIAGAGAGLIVAAGRLPTTEGARA